MCKPTRLHTVSFRFYNNNEHRDYIAGLLARNVDLVKSGVVSVREGYAFHEVVSHSISLIGEAKADIHGIVGARDQLDGEEFERFVDEIIRWRRNDANSVYNDTVHATHAVLSRARDLLLDPSKDAEAIIETVGLNDYHASDAIRYSMAIKFMGSGNNELLSYFDKSLYMHRLDESLSPVVEELKQAGYERLAVINDRLSDVSPEQRSASLANYLHVLHKLTNAFPENSNYGVMLNELRESVLDSAAEYESLQEYVAFTRTQYQDQAPSL